MYTQYDVNTVWILFALMLAIFLLGISILMLVSGRFSNVILRFTDRRNDKRIIKVAERGRRDFR